MPHISSETSRSKLRAYLGIGAKNKRKKRKKRKWMAEIVPLVWYSSLFTFLWKFKYSWWETKIKAHRSNNSKGQASRTECFSLMAVVLTSKDETMFEVASSALVVSADQWRCVTLKFFGYYLWSVHSIGLRNLEWMVRYSVDYFEN